MVFKLVRAAGAEWNRCPRTQISRFTLKIAYIFFVSRNIVPSVSNQRNNIFILSRKGSWDRIVRPRRASWSSVTRGPRTYKRSIGCFMRMSVYRSYCADEATILVCRPCDSVLELALASESSDKVSQYFGGDSLVDTKERLGSIAVFGNRSHSSLRPLMTRDPLEASVSVPNEG
jgi:hypothetical protein